MSPKLYPDGYFGDIGQYWLETPTNLLEAIESNGVDYVVLSDLWIDLAQGDTEVDAVSLPIYEALLDTYPMVAKFDRKDASLGWPVNILMVPSAEPEG